MVSEKNVAKYLKTVREKKGELLWPIAGKKNIISLPVKLLLLLFLYGQSTPSDNFSLETTSRKRPFCK